VDLCGTSLKEWQSEYSRVLTFHQKSSRADEIRAVAGHNCVADARYIHMSRDPATFYFCSPTHLHLVMCHMSQRWRSSWMLCLSLHMSHWSSRGYVDTKPWLRNHLLDIPVVYTWIQHFVLVSYLLTRPSYGLDYSTFNSWVRAGCPPYVANELNHFHMAGTERLHRMVSPLSIIYASVVCLLLLSYYFGSLHYLDR
jgi:hypothetical protein